MSTAVHTAGQLNDNVQYTRRITRMHTHKHIESRPVYVPCPSACFAVRECLDANAGFHLYLPL